MTFIIAMVVIFFSYSVFKPLWDGIFFKIRILKSSDVREVLKDFGVDSSHKNTTKHLVLLISVVACLLGIIYFSFVRYNFGYSISAFIGAVIALGEAVVGRISARNTKKVIK